MMEWLPVLVPVAALLGLSLMAVLRRPRKHTPMTVEPGLGLWAQRDQMHSGGAVPEIKRSRNH